MGIYQCKLQFKKIIKHLNKYIKKFQTSKVKWTSLFKNLSDLQYANAYCKFQKGGRGNWPRMLSKPTSVCPQLGGEPLQAHLGICWGTGPWMWEGFFFIIWEQTVRAQMTSNHKLIWGSGGKAAATEVYLYFKKKKKVSIILKKGLWILKRPFSKMVFQTEDT